MHPLIVLLSGRIAGALTTDRHGVPLLQYSEDWLNTQGSYPISLSLPLSQKEHSAENVLPALWGLLPDNEHLLQRWGSRFHVSPRNPVAILSHVGEDCAGAIQFVNEERLPQVMGGAEDGISVLDETTLGERLRHLREDRGAGRQSDDVGQFSLAGAQAKIALLRTENGDWAIPRGRIPTTHILKPPSGDYEAYVENEMFCLRLAALVDLPAAKVSKISVQGESAICVERYDRVRIDGWWHRIHQEDFCQSLSVMPQIKYQAEGGPGPGDLARILWSHSSQPSVDVHALLRALIFNYLIGGTDAHAKNYSILLGPETEVRLAPLYDISSALPYPQLQKKKIKMAMKIGSHYRWWDIRLEDWQATAVEMRLPASAAIYELAELAAILPSASAAANDSLKAEGIDTPVLDQLVKEIHFSCERVIRKFQARPQA